MSISRIKAVLSQRAKKMADDDGVSVTSAHVMGAASQLQAELISARDDLILHPAGSAHAGKADALPSDDAKAKGPKGRGK